MGDCTRSNTGDSGVSSNWFGLHWTVSDSFVDISVILDLWGCSWWLSAIPSSKSRLLSCCIGSMELLSTQYRGIVPHLSLNGKTHEFSRVAARTWGIFSSYGGLSFQYSCFFSNISTPVLLWWIPQESKLGFSGQYGRLEKWGVTPRITFYLTQWYWDS